MRSPETPFPPEEYAGRLRQVRAAMADMQFDLLIASSPENICYLCGYESVGFFVQQALIVGLTQEPVLIVRALEVPNAEASCLLDRIVGYQDHEGGSAVVARAVTNLLKRGRIGVELRSRCLTCVQLNELKELLPNCTFVDSFGAIEDPRLIKSERELAYIRDAGRIVEIGFKAALAALRTGTRERDIASAAYQAIIGAGSDWTGAPVFVSSGARSARAHTTWSDKTIASGEPVFLEVNAAKNRYHAVMMRPACLTPVPDRYHQMMDASRAGLEAALTAVRPGALAADVDRACRGAIAQTGFGEAFRLRTGYSMGVGFENFGEGPLFSLHAGNSRPLAEAMVLHICPYLSEPGAWGGAFSETIIIGKNGPETVSSVPRSMTSASPNIG
jgi:Xaa-Pro dipeptidase